MCFDFIVYAPKNDELRNLPSSSDMLFMDTFERFRRSRRLLICSPIKNYFPYLLSTQLHITKTNQPTKKISQIKPPPNFLPNLNKPPKFINLFRSGGPLASNPNRFFIIFIVFCCCCACLCYLFTFACEDLAGGLQALVIGFLQVFGGFC